MHVHAVILVILKNVCLLFFFKVKALLGLCYMLYNIRNKIKFLCLYFRQRTCDNVAAEKSYHFIPPYDHYDVIAGQV